MKTLLAVVDFSPVTDRVVAFGAELAGALNLSIYIVHVAPPDPDFVGYGVGPETVRKSVAEQFHREHGQLRAIEESLRARKVDAHALLVQGPTVEKILEEARRLKADVIVAGSHGHNALRTLLAGSVTEGLLRKASCPVVVIPSRP